MKKAETATATVGQRARIDHDGPVVISVAPSRRSKVWKKEEIVWSEFIARLQNRVVRTNEGYAEYMRMGKDQQDAIKDVGGFVGGVLKGGRRAKDSVAWRWLITLDADYAYVGMWRQVQGLMDYACCMYTTHKHCSDKPRLRLVIPLGRGVTPDEYQAVARMVASDLGMDVFDRTTFEPERLMYWPSVAQDGEFEVGVVDDVWLDPDSVLARYDVFGPDGWRDASNWPEGAGEVKARKDAAVKQGDPLEKPGVIGAFCRTYDIDEAIARFLGDVYVKCDGVDDRYTYTGGSCSGGLVVYEGKWAYSHHATDPVGGTLCNAFDLVRLHKFGLEDSGVEGVGPKDKPSYKAMVELACSDEGVRGTLGAERAAEFDSICVVDEEDGGDGWLKRIEYTKAGVPGSTIQNAVLILENDVRLKGKIRLNEFSGRVVVEGELPWPRAGGGGEWTDTDEAGLRHYMETRYRYGGEGKIRDALAVVREKNAFHPVRDYLGKLEWDGVERIDRMLVDWLGAEDSEYVRAVTRKTMMAGVARVMRPGIKFDTMLVLVGGQGIGKSYFLQRLGRGWYSDSLTTMTGKDAFEQLQGCWLLEIGEMNAMKRVEVEGIKHFLSKCTDIFRPAYARNTVTFPRQCVFWGTTNEDEFLKDYTGNRRFWPVCVEGAGGRVFDLEDREIDQFWAEALVAWKTGESLYLKGEVAEEAVEVQRDHIITDSRQGMVERYLDMLLPSGWEEKDSSSRRLYIQGYDSGMVEKGTIQRDKVCIMEVWVECFGRAEADIKWQDSRDISNILSNLPGWKKYKSAMRFSGGSVQKGFVRAGTKMGYKKKPFR